MPNTLTTPSLPPEIWFDIFSIAVQVPGVFDTTWHPYSDDLIWDGVWATVDMTDESRRMRRTIVKVSYDWRVIGRQFLFEDLVIDERAKVLALLALFEETASSGSGDAGGGGTGASLAGYGRWVKRVTIKNDIWFNEDVFPDLERLLQYCANVQIFLIGIDIDTLSQLSRVSLLLKSPFMRSLRRISVSRILNEMPPSDVFDNLTLIHSLHWVVCPSNWLLKVFPDTNESLSPVSLSKLSVLDVNITRSNATTILPTWPLPALRYLSINHISDHDISSLLPFMAINGARLLGLCLGTLQRCSSWHKLIDRTPVLENLAIDDHDLDMLQPPDSSIYPFVTHIGLVTIGYHRMSDARRIHEGLVYSMGRNLFPNLRVVRVLGERIPNNLIEAWKAPIETAARYGIRFEDRDRRLLRYNAQLAE